MAWVFVRLKWRLLANAGATGREEALGWLMRGLGILVAFIGASDLATAPRHDGAGLIAVFVAVTVGWIMLPLLMGSDRTLSVDRVASLPLSKRDLVVGLFAASLVGAPPVATLVFLSGAVVGYRHGAATVLAAADVLVMTALAIAAGRAVSAGLSAAVHSRRGRDVASIVLALVSAASYIAWRASAALASRVNHLHPSRLTDVLSWTPPGALARSLADVYAGAYPAATARLAYGVATLVAVGWLWARALGRQLTNPAATEGSGGGRRAVRLLRLRPAGPAGAVWLKDLRYMWRAPVQRASIITGVVTSGFVLLPLLTGARHEDAFPYAGAPLAFFLMSNLSVNLFGVDGEGFGIYVATGVEPALLLRAKALAATTVVGAIAALACLAGAAVSGAWGELASGLLVSAAVILLTAGTGLVVSVRSPYPVAMSAPAFGRPRRPRGSGSAGVGVLAFVFEGVAVGVLALIFFAAKVGFGAGTLPGGLIVLGCAIAIALGGLRLAAGHLGTHLPETLLALSARG
ncbi:MAG TPA: hypothetical protein VFW14_04070 [Gaiellales bacterium]|nr:hypothetical protein [Gaiellales bacterium]